MCFVAYVTPSLVLLRQAKMMWFATEQHPNTWTLIEFQVNNHATSFCVNPKDQEITWRVIVVWTLRAKRSPGGWLLYEPGGSVLCEPKRPGDHQAGDFCVNPKDQEITRWISVVCDCCVNHKDQEITRRVIVVWTLRTRRSPSGWLFCEPKGPGNHQAGDGCVNPKDQQITRQVSVVWTQRTRKSPGGWFFCEP